jgi:hypothetical protein
MARAQQEEDGDLRLHVLLPKDRKAAAVSSLSAMGSSRMPSFVTWLRRRAK